MLQYSRLCRLIHDSLHPLTVKSSVLMTNEEEKLLLITLSQILNRIKVWTAEFDSDSDNGDHVMDDLKCHSSASCCIPKITNELVFLLCLESQYGQHLAANVLVSISEFVAASGSYWEEFMQSLCFYFERMIYKVILPSSDPPIRAKHLELLDSQRVLDNARWQSVGAIVLVLRNILKQEDDAKILEIYFQVLGSCLEVIPWDAACNIILADDINAPRSSWFEFCGNLLQLVCSLAGCEEKNPAVRAIFNIFPNILTWCFGMPAENHNYSCSQSQYTRHKILVLMIRLSSLINLDCATVVSWIHLIEKYFHDLLSESVSELEADQDDCLRDSPFSGTSSHRHLQRRVIFLYVKCAFSLIGLKEHCSCGNMKSCSKRGFTALYEWLKKHLPANIHHNRDDCCKRFTKSFIQLYMHEDDMLFQILLQLTYAQPITEVVEKDILFLLSDIFDPVRLFHLFLSELHYDHQVLLDYLISKDIGASCAEYLLRCLRIICDKWNSFLEFPFRAEGERQPFPKRRKFEDEKACEHAFNKAGECLLLLKKSVESLHQKDLFPYNPQVLLRRLTRFQELCLKRV
ncbi:putative protein Line [Helianthus annuus]|nr:putative protein Line [Helianthus annuus]